MANNLNTYYQYFAILATHVQANNTVGRFAIQELEFYGTEEATPVPIQIGGGNIDKVANFRVYDKFVGEDQALEIWDAQKDEFGRAKSSMTLHKGRLGIGTTEPEGRLAVADEPDATTYGLQEFPPKPLVGYKTHIEGHGEFCVNSSNYSSAYRPWHVFNKQFLGVNFQSTTWNSLAASFTAATGLVSSGAKLGEFSGEWIQLELPYKIKLESFRLSIREDWYEYAPGNYVIAAYDENTTSWVELASYTGEEWEPKTGDGGDVEGIKNKHVGSTSYYKRYAIVISKIYNPANNRTDANFAEWKLFGNREQLPPKQSVLHDGQLTLTKSLTVPRIGPALDADDTPRRDRLVVEYNTSTNPTFEGAVRDTSGRGNDAILRDATYDTTDKSFRVGTSQDIILEQGIPGKSGDVTNVSYSIWFKADSVSAANQIIMTQISAYAVGVGLTLALNTNELQFGFGYAYSSGQQLGGAVVNAISAGQWYHVVAIKKGSGTLNATTLPDILEIYINGEKKTLSHGGGTGTLNVGSDHWLIIGAIRKLLSVRTAEEFVGNVSSIKYYDTALTTEEVKTLYDMGRCDEGHHVVNFSKTRVGIGLGDGEAPRGVLDVRGETPFIGPGLVIHQAASGNWGTQGDPANMNGLLLTLAGEPGLTTGSSYWNIAAQATGSGSLLFSHRGRSSAYIDSGNSNNSLDFTGQHRTFIKDVPFSQAGDLEGLIVSSDQNKYIKISGGIEAGSNAIMINESLPVVSLSNVVTDKRCFGVISASEDPEQRSDSYGSFVTPFEKEKGDTRVYINSVGEGAIWVVNTNGPLESGDYITTSNVAGYGQKQESEFLANYTVAKITMDCDFEPATQPVQQILRSNVIQTYYLGNVHKVKNVPHEFVTTTVTADDAWSNVSINPSDTTYAEWSNLEANTQNTYALTYTQTSNVVYDTKYTLTTTANVTESDAWDRVSIEPPGVTYAEYSNLEANTQSSYSLTFTKTTTDEKTPDEWSALESNTQSLYNMVYYQSVEEEVAATWPGATTHTRVTDVIENELDAHGQIQWEDHATETEKAYKIRYLDASGVETDSANVVHIAAFVGCTYHCG